MMDVSTNKLVARVKGGLGNQLFCYAAARRLALATKSNLVLDSASGFARDKTYRRSYGLDVFEIPCRKASFWERMEPLERVRRAAAKLLSRRLPFAQRFYVEEESGLFDARLLQLPPRKTRYLDGLWQDERYFSDVSDIIRKDLRFRPPADRANQDMAARIRACEAVSIHVRWFATEGAAVQSHNVPRDFYRRAVSAMSERVPDAHFFIFSDKPEAALALLDVPPERCTLVSHNGSEDMAYADMWLMSQCRHFILANSTFSWWGAWLGERAGQSHVVAPRVSPHPGGWDFVSMIPKRWELL